MGGRGQPAFEGDLEGVQGCLPAHGPPAAAGAGRVQAAALRVVLVVADVVGDLTLERGFQDPLGQRLQQPALTGQPQPVTTGAVHQHRD